MSVEYKQVPGYGGYKVGTDGSVWTQLARVSCGYRRGSTQIRTGEWRQLKPFDNGKGYLMVNLRQPDSGSGRRVIGVHRLVLEVFVGPCQHGMEACHNDGNRGNNTLSNLRWDTKKSNHADKYAHGTMLSGEDVHCSKLTTKQVVEIRRRACEGMSYKSIATLYGVQDEAVRRIVVRQTWKHIA